MACFKIKSGTIFSMAGSATSAGGTSTDFTGWTLASHVRVKSNDRLVEELVCTWIDEVAGEMEVKSNGPIDWPINTILEMDIKFTSPAGEPIATSTSEIKVLKRITT